MTLATISPDLAAATSWDALVVGAGPAGAVAATLLARRARRVLLVDAKRFPRAKVCGGCLSASAVSALAAYGLDDVLSLIGARPIDRIRLHWRGDVGELRLPPGYVLDRARFDTALVQGAIDAGAAFLDECSATLETLEQRSWTVDLAGPNARHIAHAKVVLVADGLLRSCLRKQSSLASHAQPGARLGVATILPWAADALAPGAIEMTIAAHGYAGAVRLDGDHTLIAAAIDAQQLQWRSISAAVEAILSTSAALALPPADNASWKTSPSLTRRPERIAGERWFAIGDAAGYDEPFTGDGMAIAIESAVAVAPLADAAVDAWRGQLATQWPGEHRRLCLRRRVLCRGLAWALRRPWATRGVIELCRRAPAVARTAFAHVQRRPPIMAAQEVAGA